VGSREYPRLDIFQFGAYLLTGEDLDPVYSALYSLDLTNRMSDEQIQRWLLAYWCFYHCGAASWISEGEGKEFAHRMTVAALNLDSDPAPIGGRWPRGHERRHFRAKNAELSLSHLFTRFGDQNTAGNLIQYLCADPLDGQLAFKTVSDRVQTLVGFGPWIAWKIADMIERVVGVRVDFSGSDIFMFKDPAEAALLLWEYEHPGESLPETKAECTGIMHQNATRLVEVFKAYNAPPNRARPVNIQEVETILCKWKSHQRGFYPINNDINEINHGLECWAPVSETAQRFRNAMPKGT
jgi:hypothetical protein